MLSSFIKPNTLAGPDQVIPPRILKNAQGLAIITVLKAGFLFSGRAGSGVIVARLPDGTWLGPLAIVTAGAGAGGQIGAELTDFVFILNTREAVDTFAQAGSVTLGTNVSVAAGPLGRNAEVAGSASLKAVSAVFAYLRTKGLFAGVSLEGLAIVERREANRKFYGNNCKARNILAGQVKPPPGADPLMRVLRLRVFNNRGVYDDDDFYNDDYYDDIPDTFSDSTSEYSRRGGSSSYGGGLSRRNRRDYSDSDSDDSWDEGRRRNHINSYGGGRSNQRTNSTRGLGWEDDLYDRRGGGGGYDDVDRVGQRMASTRLDGPLRPPASSKPNFGGAAKTNATQAIALYTFKGEQGGDLPFAKGDVIDIVEKSNSTDDWWTGRINGQVGIFPANYVELI